MRSKNLSADRLRLVLLSGICILVLIPGVLCGFEVCDSGFYATFYSNIFTHPESVSYNFMYYLSGLAGGLINRLTGEALIWLRIAGILTNLICVWSILSMAPEKKYWGALLTTTVCVCAGVLETPLSLYNDNMTAALACICLALLCKATDRENKISLKLIATAGAVAGLNTLTRIPNILEFAFVALVPLSGIKGKQLYKSILFWTAGWFAGLCAGLITAASLGHLPLLTDTIRDLFKIATTSADESTHGLIALISVQIAAWKNIVILTAKLCATGGLAWYFCRYRIPDFFKWGLWIVFGAICTKWIYEAGAVTSLASVSLSGCTGCITLLKDRRIRNIAIAGLIMMIIMPLGSDNGIYNAGTPVLWISSVAAFYFIKEKAGKTVMAGTAIILFATTVVSVISNGFYFDKTRLKEMEMIPSGTKAAGIHTSSERIMRTQRLLDQLNQYVHPGDTLMVYGSAPMLNYLTSTVPAIGCSWPELLTPGLLETRMKESQAPQYIMLLKFNTIGSSWSEPSEKFMRGENEVQNRFHNNKKSEIILKYIDKKRYQKTIESEDFVLFRKVNQPFEKVR